MPTRFLTPSLLVAMMWLATLTGLHASSPETRIHWAFQPVQTPPLPAVRDQAWPVTAIDRFILAPLEARDLSPSATTDKRSLLRRASYDLTGLPPTPDELDQFLRDDSPGAFATVIDRLLASPHYGERWGRYWLDLARYSDTKGYVYDREEKRFVHAHVYRDWVVRALNEDMPYDRFLMLQLAADRLLEGAPPAPTNSVENAETTGLAAMGYLTLGRRFLGVVHDIIDDRIDVVGRGMLGLTIGCARCHDHKFDPIPTRDYYSLYGIFASSSEQTVPLSSRHPVSKQYEAYERGLNERMQKLEKTFERKRLECAQRLRAQTGRYLEAVLNVASLPSEEFYAIMSTEDLNPVVVRQWEAYLYKNQRSWDPVFGLWHRLAGLGTNDFRNAAWNVISSARSSPPTTPINPRILQAFTSTPASMRDVAARYGAVFATVEREWTNLLAQAKTNAAASPLGLTGEAEQVRQVLYGEDSPAQVSKGAIVDVEWFFDEPSRVELARLQAEIDRWLIQAPGATPHAVILRDRPTPYHPRVFLRGNAANKGPEVPRQFLQVLSPASRPHYETGSGRLEMAHAIADEHNPLTARVLVNRVWQQHFGSGLVRTVSDFGLRSEKPSHPELLDWLAHEFVSHGWSIKHLHRLMMLSRVYQQTSVEPAARSNPGPAPAVDAAQIDPENRLCGHMHRYRLDFESMRDSLLAVTDELDLSVGGRAEELFGAKPSVRRALYGFIDRQFVASTLRCFDFANPDMHSPARPETTVPQQALFFLNNEFVIERAKRLNLLTDSPDAEQHILGLYRRVYQRAPSDEEMQAGRQFILASQAEPLPAPAPRIASAWQYGFGFYNEVSKRLETFTPLPHFTGDAWQGGPAWPDTQLGWVQLTAEGGHAGNDRQHAAVRRWTAPHASVLEIRGRIAHEESAGDGIQAFVVSSRQGLLQEWTLHNTNAVLRLSSIQVQAGDTIDFIVNLRDNLNSDMFKWRPIITGSDPGVIADGKKDFGGPPETLQSLNPWEKYAQVLLQANEFLFVD